MNELIRRAFEDTADPLWMAPGTRRFAQEYSGPVGAAQDVPYGGWPVQADALDYSGMAPGIGDVTGPMADARMYMRDPEQLTPGNVGMSLFGLAPGIPSVAPVMAGIAAPIGGNLGMLGRKLPQVGNSLREMVANAGYRIGSAPGVYTHDITPKAEVFPTSLTAPERAYLRGVGEELKQANPGMTGRQVKNALADLADQILDYRTTHHPKGGWSPAELSGYETAAPTKKPLDVDQKIGPIGKMTPKYQAQNPQFHIDQKTGRLLTGQRRADAVEMASNKMIDEIQDIVMQAGQGNKNAQYVVDQSKWYRDAENTIKDLFGVKAPMYADIQGSLSPNTRLSEQHKMAQEVWERMLDGDFEKPMARFDAHMERKPEGMVAASWARKLKDPKDKLYDPEAIIRKTEIDEETGIGKLYGLNSINAQLAMRGLLRGLKPGMAPKMRNFAGNLGGTSVDPTVDVWAGRTINRLMGGPRVPPTVDAGVPGVIGKPSPDLFSGHYGRAMSHRNREQNAMARGRQAPPRSQAMAADAARIPAPEITAQYGLASDIFKTTAQKLGMDAHDLQALMWFREKELWESKGWTPLDAQPSLVELIKRDNRQAN